MARIVTITIDDFADWTFSGGNDNSSSSYGSWDSGIDPTSVWSTVSPHQNGVAFGLNPYEIVIGMTLKPTWSLHLPGPIYLNSRTQGGHQVDQDSGPNTITLDGFDPMTLGAGTTFADNNVFDPPITDFGPTQVSIGPFVDTGHFPVIFPPFASDGSDEFDVSIGTAPGTAGGYTDFRYDDPFLGFSPLYGQIWDISAGGYSSTDTSTVDHGSGRCTGHAPTAYDNVNMGQAYNVYTWTPYVPTSDEVPPYRTGIPDYCLTLDSLDIVFTLAPMSISPLCVNVFTDDTQVFTTNKGAIFTVTEVGGGTVDPEGPDTSTTYTPPATPGTYHVVATNPNDPTDFDTAEVIVFETLVSAPLFAKKYVTTGNNRLVDFNCEITGVEWTYTGDTNDYFEGEPVVGPSGRIYCLCYINDGNDAGLVCLNADGTLAWQTVQEDMDLNNELCGIAIDENENIFVTADVVVAFKANGDIAWVWNDGECSFIRGAYPAPNMDDDGHLYIASNRFFFEGFYELTTAKSETSWFTPPATVDPDVDADSVMDAGAMAFEGDDVYITMYRNQGTPAKLDKSDGSLVWAGALYSSSGDDLVGVVVTDAAMFVLRSPDERYYREASLYAVDKTDGSELWHYDDTDLATDLIASDADGNIYAGGAQNDEIYSLNPDGTIRWTYTDADSEFKTFTGVYVCTDGIFAVSDYPSWLVRLDPSDGSLISRIAYGVSFDGNTPCVVNCNIYVAGQNTLRSYETPCITPPPSGGGPTHGMRRPFGIANTTPVPPKQPSRGKPPLFWGRPNPPNPVPLYGLWRVYFKGFVSGEDMAGAAYGLPTEFMVTANEDQVIDIQLPAVDINGLGPGRQVLLKLERDATDPLNTQTGDQVFMTGELIYDKA